MEGGERARHQPVHLPYGVQGLGVETAGDPKGTKDDMPDGAALRLGIETHLGDEVEQHFLANLAVRCWWRAGSVRAISQSTCRFNLGFSIVERIWQFSCLIVNSFNEFSSFNFQFSTILTNSAIKNYCSEFGLWQG